MSVGLLTRQKLNCHVWVVCVVLRAMMLPLTGQFLTFAREVALPPPQGEVLVLAGLIIIG